MSGINVPAAPKLTRAVHKSNPAGNDAFQGAAQALARVLAKY
jgi:hypothetical protein